MVAILPVPIEIKIKLNITKNSVTQSHQPHFSCSVATCAQLLLYWTAQIIENFHHQKKLHWAVLVYIDTAENPLRNGTLQTNSTLHYTYTILDNILYIYIHTMYYILYYILYCMLYFTHTIQSFYAMFSLPPQIWQNKILSPVFLVFFFYFQRLSLISSFYLLSLVYIAFCSNILRYIVCSF